MSTSTRNIEQMHRPHCPFKKDYFYSLLSLLTDVPAKPLGGESQRGPVLPARRLHDVKVVVPRADAVDEDL